MEGSLEPKTAVNPGLDYFSVVEVVLSSTSENPWEMGGSIPAIEVDFLEATTPSALGGNALTPVRGEGACGVDSSSAGPTEEIAYITRV